MLETRKLFATGLTLAVLATTGCYDFKDAFEDCVDAGRCDPEKCDANNVDVPDELSFDANCDGIDGDPDDAFFVDPIDGEDEASRGTREAPFRTLAHALPRAASTGKAIYLARGDYEETALRLNTPVSLHGGYSGLDGGWARGRNYVTHIRGGSIGLTVSGVDAGVLLDRLSITSAAGVNAGEPSIGVRVLNSSGVRLRYVQVFAGAGASGAVGGSDMSRTQNGLDGGAGADAGTSGTIPAGGTPGLGGGCGDNRGGTGGQGGIERSVTESVAATSGESGRPMAAGGDAGTRRTYSPSCGSSSCDYDGDPGGDGQNGRPGDAGTNGMPGTGIGRLTSDTWVPDFGTDGGNGAHGEGGGGGGGGGATVLARLTLTYAGGAGGGGGGGGGCAGAGATGGGGGGASIAVLLLQSQVELESCVLETAGGGQGGAGGKGGDGSLGGQGGPGGNSRTVQVSEPTATYNLRGGKGGKGGNGGRGGNGGHGGNGGGGPSVGVWCDGPVSSSVSARNTVFNLGNGGQPGSVANTTGEAGLQANSQTCMSTL